MPIFNKKIFNDLSIKYDLKLNTETDMSPKTMASFLDLYNASYLSNNFSDMGQNFCLILLLLMVLSPACQVI